MLINVLSDPMALMGMVNDQFFCASLNYVCVKVSMWLCLTTSVQ